MDLDSVIKVVIIAALSPVWVPVIRALYDDFEAALWREGGLFGKPPNADKLKELEKKYRQWKSPLVNEPRKGGRLDRKR